MSYLPGHKNLTWSPFRPRVKPIIKRYIDRFLKVSNENELSIQLSSSWFVAASYCPPHCKVSRQCWKLQFNSPPISVVLCGAAYRVRSKDWYWLHVTRKEKCLSEVMAYNHFLLFFRFYRKQCFIYRKKQKRRTITLRKSSRQEDLDFKPVLNMIHSHKNWKRIWNFHIP